jgi:hypothetical protein
MTTTSTVTLEQSKTLVINSGGEVQTIATEANNTVVIQNQSSFAIVAGAIGPRANSIGVMEDVDLTNLADGGLLIYDDSIKRWVAGNLLQKQVIESGQY